MAQVRVRWLQRVNGREPGQEEVCERTEYVNALASQNRLQIIEDMTPAAIVGVFIDQPLSGEDLSPIDTSANDLGQVLSENGEDPIAVDEPTPKPRSRKPAAPRIGTGD